MKNKGFTLIELMIVVAIIAIIAAIAIPNLLRSRVQSNESAAIGNLRTVLGGQNAYNSSTGTYAATFALLTGATPPFLDGAWGGSKNGYGFVMGGGAGQTFSCTATATTQATTGVRSFFVDESGVLRAAPGAGATVASTPLGE
jgi:prepilin-type N-terminal cleavage/methylation domain-containing protein